MTEHVEWELVDGPAPNDKHHDDKHRSDRRQTAQGAARMLLGRWWKWKIAGTAVVTLVTLAFFATLTGALVLLFAAGTLLSAGLRKLKHWLGYGAKSGSTPVKL